MYYGNRHSYLLFQFLLVFILNLNVFATGNTRFIDKVKKNFNATLMRENTEYVIDVSFDFERAFVEIPKGRNTSVYGRCRNMTWHCENIV